MSNYPNFDDEVLNRKEDIGYELREPKASGYPMSCLNCQNYVHIPEFRFAGYAVEGSEYCQLITLQPHFVHFGNNVAGYQGICNMHSSVIEPSESRAKFPTLVHPTVKFATLEWLLQFFEKYPNGGLWLNTPETRLFCTADSYLEKLGEYKNNFTILKVYQDCDLMIKLDLDSY